MKNIFALLAMLTLALPYASAQDDDALLGGKWYFGLGEGLRWGGMHFTDIDGTVFPNEDNLPAQPVFSFFVERNFGAKGQFGLRPEITYAKRGGTVSGIYSREEGLYEAFGVSDVRYRLRANYLDLRVPLFFRFGNRASKFRPYVFAGPVIGLAKNGSIRAEWVYDGGFYEGVRIDATKANLASIYFGGLAGPGVKWFFNAGRHRAYLGADVAYEFGLSDTYGSDEKDGKEVRTDMIRLKQYPEPHKVLFLNTTRAFVLFKEAARRSGDKIIPENTLREYMKNADYYLGYKRSCRFYRMTNGYVEREPGVAGEQGKPKTSTYGTLVFDYEFLAERYGVSLTTSSGGSLYEAEETAVPAVFL